MEFNKEEILKESKMDIKSTVDINILGIQPKINEINERGIDSPKLDALPDHKASHRETKFSFKWEKQLIIPVFRWRSDRVKKKTYIF